MSSEDFQGLAEEIAEVTKVLERIARALELLAGVKE